MKELFKALTDVQNECKVAKNLRNTFGGFSYRNAEQILEAIKPLLVKNNVAVYITDDIVKKCDRDFVEATVHFIGDNGTDEITTKAYAQLPIEKKGMDPCQLTGCASSYARKYALNGMFLLDDNKDSDALDNTTEGTAKPIADSSKIVAPKFVPPVKVEPTPVVAAPVIQAPKFVAPAPVAPVKVEPAPIIIVKPQPIPEPVANDSDPFEDEPALAKSDRVYNKLESLNEIVTLMDYKDENGKALDPNKAKAKVFKAIMDLKLVSKLTDSNTYDVIKAIADKIR
jgi:hypothetical protein